MIICTCGHSVEAVDDATVLNLKFYEPDFGNRCIATVSYCKECATMAYESSLVLTAPKDEEEWMRGEG